MLGTRDSECAAFGEFKVLLGGVTELAACTSASASERLILRGAFEELDGEGKVLTGAVAIHCVRADGGPGSFEVLDADDAALLSEGVAPFGRNTGPKSLIMLPSPPPAMVASSMGRFPSEDEARLVSGLGSACLRLGKVDVDAISDKFELKRVLALSEGMLDVAMLRMGRVSLLSCDVVLSSDCGGDGFESLWMTTLVSLPAAVAFEASFDALCWTSAARKENLGEVRTPSPPIRDCCCGLRLGEGERDCCGLADMLSVIGFATDA